MKSKSTKAMKSTKGISKKAMEEIWEHIDCRGVCEVWVQMWLESRKLRCKVWRKNAETKK